MAIFLLLSAALKRILLYKIHCASVQHSLSPPESFIVSTQDNLVLTYYLHIGGANFGVLQVSVMYKYKCNVFKSIIK